MEQVDLTPILADPRTTLLVGESVDAVASKLPAAYLPAVDGDLHTVNLTSLTRVRPTYFRELIAELQRVMDCWVAAGTRRPLRPPLVASSSVWKRA